MRTSGETNNTPGQSNLHKTGLGTEKPIKRGAKAFSLSLSRAIGHSTLHVFGSTCAHKSTMDFPAIISINRAVTLSCNTDLIKSYNTVCPPRAVTLQEALMSVTPNFCCDETKNRGAYSRDSKAPFGPPL